MPTPPPVPTDRNSVSASELVRQFGLWQEQAAREPVYVMHRGRARLVLTSVDLMNRLCAPRDTGSSGTVEHSLLLAMMREPVIRLDADARVVGVNAAAESWLGHTQPDIAGLPLTGVMDEAMGRYCDALIRRSCRFATIETAELPFGDHGLTITIAPTGSGAILVGTERSIADESDAAGAMCDALSAAVAATGMGHARINLRGYIERSDPGLERLSGVPAAILESTRFVSLVATGSRVPVGDALDQVLRDGQMRSIEAMLHRNRADDLPVVIGIAAVRPRIAIEAAVAVIRERSG